MGARGVLRGCSDVGELINTHRDAAGLPASYDVVRPIYCLGCLGMQAPDLRGRGGTRRD